MNVVNYTKMEASIVHPSTLSRALKLTEMVIEPFGINIMHEGLGGGHKQPGDLVDISLYARYDSWAKPV